MKDYKPISYLSLRPMYYILENKIPMPASLEEWAANFENINNRRVKETSLDGNIRVSTVFLGLDHSIEGPPVLFETMVLGGTHDFFQERYSTYEEAEKGHEEAVNMVLNK